MRQPQPIPIKGGKYPERIKVEGWEGRYTRAKFPGNKFDNWYDALRNAKTVARAIEKADPYFESTCFGVAIPFIHPSGEITWSAYTQTIKRKRGQKKAGKSMTARLWTPNWQYHPIVVRIGKMHYELTWSTMLYSEATKSAKELGLGNPRFTMLVTENTPEAAMKVMKAYTDSL